MRSAATEYSEGSRWTSCSPGCVGVPVAVGRGRKRRLLMTKSSQSRQRPAWRGSRQARRVTMATPRRTKASVSLEARREPGDGEGSLRRDGTGAGPFTLALPQYGWRHDSGQHTGPQGSIFTVRLPAKAEVSGETRPSVGSGEMGSPL